MRQKKILIIEDDQSLVRLLDRSLESDRVTMILAIDAAEGYKKAVAEKPDLIILDIVLPSNNGFVCLEKLKQDSKTKKIPVIILSNLGQAEEIRQGLQAGAVDYLVKADYSITEVKNKIFKYLK